MIVTHDRWSESTDKRNVTGFIQILEGKRTKKSKARNGGPHNTFTRTANCGARVLGTKARPSLPAVIESVWALDFHAASLSADQVDGGESPIL